MRYCALLALLVYGTSLQAQTPDSLRFYAALVEQNPDDSRAVYRLAALKPRGSAESIALLERYTRLEPADAWGYLALAETQAVAGKIEAALGSIGMAEKLAPGEPDIDAVKARVAAARRARAPAFQPRISFTRDSDANQLLQLDLAADVASGATARWGAAIMRSSVRDGVSAVMTNEARAYLNVRSAVTRLELAAGAARLETTAPFTTPVARARLRWQPTVSGASVVVRAVRAPVLVSPLLAINRTVLTEARGTVELPIAGALRVRGIAQAGDLSAVEAETTSRNTRLGVGGALVLRASSVTDLAATYYQLTYDAPSAAGYFAPRLVQIAELGSYAEIYRLDPVTIAVDVGAGVQRVADHGAPVGKWSLTARGWGQVSTPLSSALDINLEVEAYQSQLNLVAASQSWNSLSTSLSLRWRVSRAGSADPPPP